MGYGAVATTKSTGSVMRSWDGICLVRLSVLLSWLFLWELGGLLADDVIILFWDRRAGRSSWLVVCHS